MKRHQIFKLFIIVTMGLMHMGCKKVIDIQLLEAAPGIVIEGNVTNHLDRQVVTISRTVPFGEPNRFPAVSGAEVFITDNDGMKKILLEQMPGVYVTTDLKGKVNTTYQLHVLADGQIYTATSTMPELVKVDSMGIAVTTFFNEKYNSVEVYYQDLAGTPNYYRYKLWINDVLSTSIFIYNDDFTDGKTVKRELRDFDKDMLAGDEIKFEMHSIDQPVYKYWSGLNQNGNRGQASTTPANPVSNISNGALGYFSAHTVEKKTFTIR